MIIFSQIVMGQSKKSDNKIERDILEIEKKESKNIDNFEIIERVEGFYDRSWNKLMWLIGVGGTLIGFIIPYFTKQQQIREFEAELKRYKESFEKILNQQKIEFENYIEVKGKENELGLKEFFKQQYNLLREENIEDISILNSQFSNKLNTIYAMHFKSQGLLLLLNNIGSKEGLISLVRGVKFVLKNDDDDYDFVFSIVEPIKLAIENGKDKILNDLVSDEVEEIMNVLFSLKERYPEEIDIDIIIDILTNKETEKKDNETIKNT